VAATQANNSASVVCNHRRENDRDAEWKLLYSRIFADGDEATAEAEEERSDTHNRMEDSGTDASRSRGTLRTPLVTVPFATLWTKTFLQRAILV
jgi:hypothetical protein